MSSKFIQIQIFRLSIILCLTCLNFTTTGCSKGTTFRFDEGMSIQMRNVPYLISNYSEIRIYKTETDYFLSSSQIDKMTPVKILISASEMTELFETMKKGHTSNQDPTLRDFHYLPECFHIVGFSPSKAEYGYLKVQISFDKGKPIVARAEPLSETNSFEYMTLLPELLVRLTSAPRSVPNN